MNKLLSAAWVFVLFFILVKTGWEYSATLPASLHDYIVNNFEADCGTRNAVTAILMNYRMYDTMFEVLILLTAIIGMKQFLPARNEFHTPHPAKGSPGGPDEQI